MPQWQSEHEKLADEKRAALQKLADQAQRAGVPATCELLRGNYSQQIIAVAQAMKVDLIVRSAKGTRSQEQGSIGATSNQLLRRSPCALWLTQGDQAAACKKILAAVDATPDDDAHAQLNQSILEQAQELVRREGCELHVVYVWDIYDSELLQDRLPHSEFERMIERNRVCHAESFQTLLKPFGMTVDAPNVHLLRGRPTVAIPELIEASQFDLLVCGTVARAGLTGLVVGNTANRMLSRVSCSILAVR